jgi:hypothetical protein
MKNANSPDQVGYWMRGLLFCIKRGPNSLAFIIRSSTSLASTTTSPQRGALTTLQQSDRW